MPSEMFQEALLESGAQHRPRRGWATLASLLLQIALVSFAVAMPMIYTDALSVRYKPHSLASPNVAAPEHEPQPQGRPSAIGLHAPANPTFVNAGRRYDFHTVGTEEPSPAPCCVTALAPGNGISIVSLLPPGVGPTLSVKRDVRPVVTSRLMEGRLVHRVQPVYPHIALLTHSQGTVILQAVIGKDGHIQQLHVVSGAALLSGAAVDAVKQWEYRPYLLNGEAVEVRRRSP